MWFRSKSHAAPSSSRSRAAKHNLDFLNSHGFAPQNSKLMSRIAESSSFNPSGKCVVEEGEVQDHPSHGGDGGVGRAGGEGAEEGGSRAGMGTERLAEEGRAGGESCWGSRGARVSSSSHENAAGVAKEMRAPSSIADGAESAVGGKATAEGAPMNRSLTADATGTNMARGTPKDMGDLSAGGASMWGAGRASVGGAILKRSVSDVLLQDAEIDEMDRDVLQEAFSRVVALQQRVQHYRDLGVFLLHMVLFTTILYLQADSSRSYDITAAHSVLYPTGMSADALNTFAGPGDLYEWLNTSIVQNLWADPPCGDGTCDRPFQFPAFGRFGCQADCGTFPNLTSIVISFSSQLDATQDAADEPSWNLCMVNPISLCWGAVHAPPPGTRRFSVIGSASSVQLAAWGDCAKSEVAGAFVDCARMCVVEPSAITPYAGTPCPVPDIASLFPNTPCNTSSSSQTTRMTPTNRRKALYRGLHHSHSRALWPASAAMGQSGAASLPASAAVPRTLAASAASSAASGAAAATTAFAATHIHGARKLEVTPMQAPPAPPAPPATAAAAAAAGTASTAATTAPSIWLLLGATDRQRLEVLQVAVSRALYTIAKDRCLVGLVPIVEATHAQGGPGGMRRRMVASLCTMLGGPVTAMEECRLMDDAGQQVVGAADLYVYLQRMHLNNGSSGSGGGSSGGGGGSVMQQRAVSLQHMQRFVQTVVAALRSVTPISDDAAARLHVLLRAFDDAIVSSRAVGCSQGGAWLQWRAGVSHNTTIYVGDKVTWVWDDDLPHSLRVAGMGEMSDPFFEGFGGHRMAVSRQLPCTPMNVGETDATHDPLPCVLRMDDEAADSFTYSRVFDEPATIYYEDGALPGNAFALSSSSSASSASVLTVLPARERSAAAVNVTGTSTNSSNATTTTTTAAANTTTTTNTTNTTNATTNTNVTFAPNFCAPGCRLRRLANGVCDAACNTPTCAFDGGDCACVDPLFGPGICTCPAGHTRRDDGSCCVSTAVGSDLNFPFSLQRYGPNYLESNYAFAAEREVAVNRFVSRHNRLLIGMMLQQERWGTQVCSGQGVLHLEGWCSNGTSLEPYGVNPHFLPSSSLYDGSAGANMSELDNGTFGVKLQFNAQGFPYGFIRPTDSVAAYPLVFDVNLDNEAATKRLQYLVDGNYIDNATRSVQVSFVTFNGEARTFVLTTVKCTVNGGGGMTVTFKSQPAAMALYDASSARNVVRLVLEILYLLGLLSDVWGEVYEMVDQAFTSGHVLSYFGHVWNWVDMLSISLQVTAVIIWVVLWQWVSAFDVQARYDIYYTLLEMPRYWAVPNPPTGFLRATQAFMELQNIITLRAVYFAMQGINLFFLMVRLLKLMDFQPYLGVITRSLALATPSLLHFFLLSFTVFSCFSMFAYLVFGGALEMFSTVLQSMFSCFLLLLNDNSSAYFFQRMESWDLIAAMLFFLMFIVLLVFILLNFLIAIIVDAFMTVKDGDVVATSIVADLAHIIKYKWNCWRGRYLPYHLILNRLVDLGARDTRPDERHRFRTVIQWVQARLPTSRGSRPEPPQMARSENRAAFPSASSASGMRRQHALRVREKCIDAISLSMILQRRHDRAGPLMSNSSPKHRPAEWLGEGEEEAGLEQLSHALVVQCGEVVRHAALPVKEPAQKLSLTHIKEELEHSQAAVEELRDVVMGLQGLIVQLFDRTLPATGAGAAVTGMSAQSMPHDGMQLSPSLQAPPAHSFGRQQQRALGQALSVGR
ncbi:unnamed protein product [Closterium sp. Yama58-4]|nr:unnamed protein product [Closterium sp. Yama58-4]